LQNQLDTATAEVLADYDFLDATHDDFDPTLNMQIVALRDALYEGQGGRDYHIGDALKEATDTILYRHRPDLFEPAAPAADAVPAAPAALPAKTVQVAKKLEQAAAQAPKTGSAGGANAPASAPSIDVFEMSEEAFDALTDAEIKAMRGDLVV
jgi:hypothetical protein